MTTASIEFLGGVGTVTGSKFLVEAHGGRLLVECGLYQGLKELRLRNWDRPPVDPASIESVVLTHGHIDHSGYLPRFMNDGFRGPVYATRATADLLKILLPDSGHLQEEEAEYHNRHGTSTHKPALPLYTAEDGLKAAERVTGLRYEDSVRLARGVRLSFHRAGHILGSATVCLQIHEGNTRRRLIFSSDLGRYGAPILTDPAPIGEADYIVVEMIHGLSAHADADGLVRWLRTVARSPRRVFVGHGEPGPSAALAARIRNELGWEATVPGYRDRATLD